MQRIIHRVMPTALLVGALLLGAGLSGAVAEDEMADAETIQWIDGFEAGVEAAKKDGRLIFLYFGRKNPH